MTPASVTGAWSLPASWRVLALLLPLVRDEWRHHPWRHSVAALAVALGVALAWSVHVINASALSEFSAAVRAANGEPDAVLRGLREGFGETLLDRVAAVPGVERASPVLEVETYAVAGGGARIPVKVLGLDVLVAATLAPEVVPRVDGPAAIEASATSESAGRTSGREGADAPGGPLGLVALDPQAVFLNAAARERLTPGADGTLALQAGPNWPRWRVAGSIAAGGPPLVVMDIAAAQAAFGAAGRLTRIDLRLAAGVAPEQVRQQLAPHLGAGVQWARDCRGPTMTPSACPPPRVPTA
jgi:putative ABC transport system permease protein